MKKETNVQTLDKVLLLHYSIDVRLNDLFKSTTTSYHTTSTLFKGIFKPLQKHWVNATQITSVYGTATINMSSIKEGISLITEKLQFHDVIEQRLKHIRQINTDLIKELIVMKNSSENRSEDDAHVKLIAEINSAQLVAIAGEYKSYCKRLDDTLHSIIKYLSDLNDFTEILGRNSNPETAVLISENAELADKITLFISTFRKEYGYRDGLHTSITKMTEHLFDISSSINAHQKAPVSHPKLKRLESLYTTQKEREIFSSLVNIVTRQPIRLSNHSDIDLF
jgi:hypothetical protein